MKHNDRNISGKTKSLFSELTNGFSVVPTETRAENAWGVAVKFMNLLNQQVNNEDQRKKLMSAWYKSVRDDDFRKFKRALRRYNKWVQEGEK